MHEMAMRFWVRQSEPTRNYYARDGKWRPEINTANLFSENEMRKLSYPPGAKATWVEIAIVQGERVVIT